jgi:hypothetical protein
MHKRPFSRVLLNVYGWMPFSLILMIKPAAVTEMWLSGVQWRFMRG